MRALVTGANPDGIGGAICRRLVHDATARGEAVRLVLGTTDASGRVTRLCNELRGAGASAVAIEADLARTEAAARLVDQAIDECSGLDALVLNAGAVHAAPLTELRLEDWETTFSVNVRSVWLAMVAARPALAEVGGAIVAIASNTATVPQPGNVAYSASKAALVALVRGAAIEWAPGGVRANCVSPGPIHTSLTDAVYAQADVRTAREALVPLRRIGRPEDVSGLVAFLVGPDATFITGEDIVVDGGLTRAALRGFEAGLSYGAAPMAEHKTSEVASWDRS